MKFLIVFDHPYGASSSENTPHHRSYSAAWRQQKTKNPLVASYQARLIAADHIVFIFPIWWESMPAITKGFLYP